MRSESREPDPPNSNNAAAPDQGDAPLEVVLTAGIVCGSSAGVCYMLSRSFELDMPAVVLALVLGGLAAVLLCGYVCVKIADARPVRRETGD